MGENLAVPDCDQKSLDLEITSNNRQHVDSSRPQLPSGSAGVGAYIPVQTLDCPRVIPPKTNILLYHMKATVSNPLIASTSTENGLGTLSVGDNHHITIDMPPASPTNINGVDTPAGARTNFRQWVYDSGDWLLRRFNRNARYPSEADRILLQASLGSKLLPPLVTTAAAVAVTYQPADGMVSLKPSVPLLFKFVCSGLLCLFVGEVLQTHFPELAVLAMLASKALWYASLFAVILNLVGHGWLITGLVYLTIAVMCIGHIPMLYEILTEGVREPEEDV